MRYFYDCEFLEDGRTIELISIGIVAEDGRELYLVNRDAPWRRIKKHQWLMDNVVPNLPQPHGDWILHMPKRWLINLADARVQSRQRIAEQVRRFLLDDPATSHDERELWADFSAYDYVALAQLFGPMIDMPVGLPWFTCDLRQEWRRLGRPELPKQESGEHNALADARHLKRCFEALQALN